MPAYVTRRAPRSPKLDARKIQTLANRMLRELELPHGELSVLLTDDVAIHELNLEHRGKDKPTDVLAFPQEIETPAEAALAAARGGELVLGDVVISLDTAERQARSRRRELIDEVCFLLAHGLLHLVGYDHAEPDEKREMTRMTRRLVKAAARDV
jgi:probable rRNA maturation factor